MCGGQAQGKSGRMDSVSSSRQPSPEFPERPVASGGVTGWEPAVAAARGVGQEREAGWNAL